MSQAAPSTVDLLADLVAEFQPDKKARAAKPAKASEVKPQTLTTQRAREEYLESSSRWVPVAVVHHVTEQHCLCCDGRTEILGNTLVRHKNPTLFAFWEIQRGNLKNLDHLPREFLTHQETVEACPSCLRAEEFLCSFPPSHPHQIPLFQ